jgi:hypothetical protein
VQPEGSLNEVKKQDTERAQEDQARSKKQAASSKQQDINSFD